MRTARLLTVSQHALGSRGGVCLPKGGRGGVCLGGCLPGGVSAWDCLPRGVSASGPRGCLHRGCLSGGVCLRGVFPGGVSTSGPRGMSAQWGVSASGPGGCGGVADTPPRGQTHLWKHKRVVKMFRCVATFLDRWWNVRNKRKIGAFCTRHEFWLLQDVEIILTVTIFILIQFYRTFASKILNSWK